MKEYVVKHNGYYLQETSEYVNEMNLAYRVKDIKHATPFHSLKSAISYAEELGLNLNNVSFVELETIITETLLVKVGNQWLPQDEVEECSVCGERHPMNELHKGVVDFETGLEFMCSDCYEEADLIVMNQPLDELGGVFGE